MSSVKIYTDASFKEGKPRQYSHAGISCSINQDTGSQVWIMSHIQVTSNGRAEATAIEMALRNLPQDITDKTVTILNDNLPLVMSINGESNNHCDSDSSDVVQRIRKRLEDIFMKNYNRLLAAGWTPEDASQIAKDKVQVKWLSRQDNHAADAMAYHALSYLPMDNSKRVMANNMIM